MMPTHTCDICGAEFQRSAHLSRHKLLHGDERPFRCRLCSRTFARRDTMQRHQVVHNRTCNQDLDEGPGRRVKHACRKCSETKQRCDGNHPCNRCVQKNAQCLYRGPDPDLPEVNPDPKLNPNLAVLRPSSESARLSSSRFADSVLVGHVASGSTGPADVHDHRHDAGPAQILQPEFSSTANDLRVNDLMTDYSCDVAFPSLSESIPSDGFPTQVPLLDSGTIEFPDWENQAFGTSAFPDWEHQAFCTRSLPPYAAAWGIFQYSDNLFHEPNANLTDPPQGDVLVPSPNEMTMAESDLMNNVTSPPAPSFLDARASPEPLEGQSLRFDEYIRRTFANRRHLPDKKPRPQSDSTSDPRPDRALPEKAHIPPLLGDFSPFLSSGSDESTWESENLQHVPYLPQGVYQFIALTFRNLNMNWGPYIQFAGGKFPCREACNAFMQLYFEEFDPLFPCLHRPTFEPATTPWLLVLATIAIGARYAREPAAADCGDILQEYLRRAFFATIEADYGSTYEPWLAQAGLLNQIGMAFSKDMRLMQAAQSMRSVLASICRQINCFHERRLPRTAETTRQSDEEVWKSWLRSESRRRLAYTLWLVDTQYLLLFDLPPLITTNLLRLRLPCCESLWRASTAHVWLNMYKQPDCYRPLSIRDELIRLYRTHRHEPGMGDFALLLLMAGVFRDAMQAQQTLGESSYLLPLLDHSGSTSTTQAQTQAWAGDTRFDAARKKFATSQKAMRYLGVLCPTEDVVARRSSLHSACLQHYHAIGLSLIIPLGELFCYCGYRVTSIDIEHCETRLLAWVQRRGIEARQMSFHAGRLFANIRQSDLHYYYEGRLMMFACQALWIYAAMTHTLATTTTTTTTTATTTTGIRLDQPLTVEAIECWIKDGQQTRLCLAGVGNLYGPQGVHRLIQEASRVLSACTIWPFTVAQAKCLRIFHQLRTQSLPKA